MSKIKKELKRFLVAGVSSVATDLATYYFLLNILSYSYAKSISFILGTSVAYIINKYWTFEKKERCYKEIGKFIVLYSSTLIANVSFNQLTLFFYPQSILFAFLVATGVSTILNFVGQKWWVFK